MLNIHYVPGIVLGPRTTAVKKTDTVSDFKRFTSFEVESM